MAPKAVLFPFLCFARSWLSPSLLFRSASPLPYRPFASSSSVALPRHPLATHSASSFLRTVRLSAAASSFANPLSLRLLPRLRIRRLRQVEQETQIRFSVSSAALMRSKLALQLSSLASRASLAFLQENQMQH